MSYREAFIRQNFGYLTDRQMGEKLGLKRGQVEYLRYRMGLKAKTAKVFTEDEERVIFEMYGEGYSFRAIGRSLKANEDRVSNFVNANIDRMPEECRERMKPIRGRVLSTAKDYAGQFGDPYEAFLMVMKRRQEVEGLLLSAANIGNSDNHPETNEVGRLLPYWQDLNGHLHRLARMLPISNGAEEGPKARDRHNPVLISYTEAAEKYGYDAGTIRHLAPRFKVRRGYMDRVAFEEYAKGKPARK